MSVATYQAWHDPDDFTVTCGTVAEIAEFRRRGELSARAEFLYSFEAATHEEAAAIHYLRMGWGAYNPTGPASPCSACGAWTYPHDSGDCWRCNTANA